MAEMDDLFKSIQMFTGAVKQYQTQQAVNDATKMMEELQSQALDEKQRLQANQQVGNALALSLTGIGADAASVQAATQGLIMSPTAQATTIAQAEMQASGEAGQTKRAQMGIDSQAALTTQKETGDTKRTGMNNETAIKVAEIGAESRSKAAADKEKQSYVKFADKFRSEKKATLDARTKLGSLRELLQQTPSRVGVEMAKTGLLKFSGEDKISDTDIARAERDPSMRASIARRIGLEMTGESLADDRTFYGAILTHAEKMMNKKLRDDISGYSKGVGILSEIDPSKLEEGLIAQLGVAPKPHDAAINAANAWVMEQLAKGVSATDPKIQAAQAKIRKLQQEQ
jgi:hypothetical protein